MSTISTPAGQWNTAVDAVGSPPLPDQAGHFNDLVGRVFMEERRFDDSSDPDSRSGLAAAAELGDRS